ncbi:hypothetical protein RJ639_032148 [Escallonia herrerae]|uniref:Uncharacterized protein n=1 Tax=Escallonia herrerae TaxID=1293975 RepID=A0AA88X0L1_9ASTE|nr:hypothetical protein RJ639_032148 [Escallonia herrerae]
MAYQETMQEKNWRKGPWLEQEDEQLNATVTRLGERRWDALAKASGLRRSGKSCRLRWMNYLRPNLKHGLISEEEERIILQLHEQWGNKWSKIAQRLPGRTDNEIKNYWRSHLRKKAQGVAFDAKQDLVTSDCNTVITARTSNGDCMSEKEDDIRATSVDSSDALELPNFALADSPYEARVSDWMSYWANEQSRLKLHDGNCYSLETCFCYLAWTSETILIRIIAV